MAREQLLGFLAAVAPEVRMQQVHHGPEVAAFLDVDLEEVAQVVERRARMSEQALLLDGRGLRIALRDDQAAQRRAVFARHLLPRRLAHLVAESDPAVGDRIGEENAPAILGHFHRAVVRPALRVDRDRSAQVDVGLREVARAHFAPPSKESGLPVLERALQLAIVREVDVIRDSFRVVDSGHAGSFADGYCKLQTSRHELYARTNQHPGRHDDRHCAARRTGARARVGRRADAGVDAGDGRARQLGVRAARRVPGVHVDIRTGRRARQCQGAVCGSPGEAPESFACALRRVRPGRSHVCGDVQFRRQALRRNPRRARRAAHRRARAARRLVRRAARGDRAGMGRGVAYACARSLRAGRPGGKSEMSLSTADHSVAPPRIDVPRDYNAAHDLIERNLAAGRGAKVAYIDDAGQLTYAQLAERVNRFASGLTTLGLDLENRVLIAMLDTIDWPVAFLGAIKAGIVPVAVNTLL